MRTTETNVSNTLGNCQASNMIYGFDKYEKVSDQSIARISLNSTKDSVIDELEGYTLLSKNIPVRGHNDAESKMDFTGLGTTIGIVSFDEALTELNATYWRKNIEVDGLKTGETSHMVLSTIQIEECFNETVKFYGVEIVTEEDGLTPITEEDGITYIIED